MLLTEDSGRIYGFFRQAEHIEHVDVCRGGSPYDRGSGSIRDFRVELSLVIVRKAHVGTGLDRVWETAF